MRGSYIALMADLGTELQTMMEVVQVYVVRWRMKFNIRKSKIMVVGEREGRWNELENW